MNNSLFAASAADLTIEHIRALAAQPDQMESLTPEFKREYSPQSGNDHRGDGQHLRRHDH
ncbi:hypothetical protein OHB35_44820 [Streptomyces phaeochromogenes]|uniref:Uncharacterized protein n=1 Tax=Streptomyces phaeochromogenes TaxID=1923 RepID=A0ABZ1HQU1_STRPH|nr:hypothetical protein [Streptomyces phaeochromogenes]WSD19791.1 hypothetical protein OHB35_44820 [Streptomyces phaeochromogenes]